MAVWETVNKKVRDFLETSDFQQKNRFKFFVSDVLSSTVTLLYLRSITFPVSNDFEYQAVNGHKHVKGVMYPETVAMTFIEDEKGTVLRYLNDWITTIADRSVLFRTSLIFNDNQEEAKKTGNVLLQTANGEISPQPVIHLEGLSPKKIDDITVSHDEDGILLYTTNFSVDYVDIVL